MPAAKGGIEVLLADVGSIVVQEVPHLLRLFEVFAQEARFGRAWLDKSLRHVGRGEAILEIGGGMLLLSCQLAKEGYAVTALEPLSEGFSHFSALQDIVMRYAQTRGIAPAILQVPVEQLKADSAFALVFSINVMEHVGDVSAAMSNAVRALKPGAQYRFVCPNYLFPYESHFEIPTLFSKRLTGLLLGRWIRRSPKVVDAAGVWKSLNWITVPQVLRIARSLPGCTVRLDRAMFRVALERAVYDKEFSARRAPWVRLAAKVLVGLGLHRTTELLPPHVQPIIDCTMTRSPHIACQAA